MKLEGGERLVLKILRDLQGDSTDYVDDARLASATKMIVEDVRDWLETLEGKGFVERARGTAGFSAYVTAKGKQALRLTEPIPSPTPPVPDAGSGASIPVAPPATVRLNPQEDRAASPKSSGLVRTISATAKITGPIRLFYSYSHKDEELRKELEDHLSLLRRQGVISGWHDRMIGAGEEWRGQLDKNLEEARVILLLVSASFLASDYCWDVETERAVERHDRGEARVIPVILRQCDWLGAPFGKLQSLPRDGKAITSWPNRDEAFTEVALGIRRAVEAMTANPR